MKLNRCLTSYRVSECLFTGWFSGKDYDFFGFVHTTQCLRCDCTLRFKYSVCAPIQPCILQRVHLGLNDGAERSDYRKVYMNIKIWVVTSYRNPNLWMFALTWVFLIPLVTASACRRPRTAAVQVQSWLCSGRKSGKHQKQRSRWIDQKFAI